ncbi:MAG: PaaI family thioesterase [Deltaproteobacteria bacterium]|nr:PaaI family thioesterase [Deltaproteobacteria bacterium]
MADEDPHRRMLDLYWDTSKATATEMWQQKRRLARAMRLVIERLVPSNAPEDELRRAADGLEQYAERLKKHPRLKSAIGHAESANAGDVGAFFDQSPMIGLANPLSPPITVAKSGERSALASVTFGSAYEGPPGAVHGGFVAAAFDEVLGFVQSLSSNPGFTGTLTVKYRSPAPLHTELRLSAEIIRFETRKIFTEARMHAGDLLCAEAEAIFITARPGKIEDLREARRKLEERIAKQAAKTGKRT